MKNIEVEHLTKDYGFGRGVFDVSFSVEEGQVLGFLGPNGAGKSTTIRHLMGFSRPDSGKTKILGMDSFGCYDKFMKDVGYLPGEIALPSALSGWQFIDMMKKLKNIKDDSVLNGLLDLFELDPKGETKRMSMGDKRKLAIVTAFMNDPKILILDEPTSGLDLGMQQTFIEFIKKEKRRGKTILLSSHMFGEVEETCDDIAIIKEGKIVSNFNKNEFKHRSDKEFLISFKNKQSKNKFLSLSKQNTLWTANKIDDFNVSVLISDSNINELIGVISNLNISNFAENKLSLENYFMQFYKEDHDFGGLK